MINNDAMRTLRRVTDAGYNTSAQIIALTGRQMKSICKSLAEMVSLLELQETLRNGGDPISWLTQTEEERKELDDNDSDEFGL